MTPPVFVLRPDDLADARAGSVIRLAGDEGRHAITVLRLVPGEALTLVDAHGRRATGSVAVVIDRQTLDVDVQAVHDEVEPELRVTVVQALAKGDRGELAVELLTEVGVDEIVPWAAARSITQWRGDRIEKSGRKWADAAVAAAKQSRRARFPLLSPLAGMTEVCERISRADTAIVLHEDATVPLGAIAVPTRGEVLVVVGPEGGVSPEEITAFTSAGAHLARLGPTVLRTSSAGMAAVAVLLAASPRWSAAIMKG